MDHLKEKKKQIEKILDVLKRSNVSTDKFDSSDQPFFKPDSEKFNFEINHENNLNVPEGLNRNIKLIYGILGNSKKEIYIGEWTIMSLERVTEQYENYCNSGQERVFDIGFRYMGMGHIELIACDLETHLLFYHRGGGSNGWDREANYNEIVKYPDKEYEQFYFTNWFYKIKIDEN